MKQEAAILNVYDIAYPGFFNERPDYSVTVTAETAGKAKYDAYLDFSDSWDMTFFEYLKIIKVTKVGSSKPTKAEAEQARRLEVVHRIIEEIGRRGRRFLYSKQHDRYASFFWSYDQLWLIDDYTGNPLMMANKKGEVPRDQHHHFSHGGTLWGLVNDFKDYLLGDDDANHNNGYGGLYCPHWGYPEEDMQAIRALAIDLGYLKEPTL